MPRMGGYYRTKQLDNGFVGLRYLAHGMYGRRGFAEGSCRRWAACWRGSSASGEYYELPGWPAVKY